MECVVGGGGSVDPESLGTAAIVGYPSYDNASGVECTMTNYELETTGKGGCGLIEYYLGICLEYLGKTTKPRQDSQFFGRDLN